MRWPRSILLASALALCGGYALSQSGIISSTLTGNEVIICAIGGPGGSSIFCPVAELRNATGYQFVSATVMPTPVSPTNLVNTLMLGVQPGVSPTVIFSPTQPYDGQLFQVCNVSNGNFATTPLTLTATAGQTFAPGLVTALGTLNARVCDEYQYTASNTTWYQLR